MQTYEATHFYKNAYDYENAKAKMQFISNCFYTCILKYALKEIKYKGQVRFRIDWVNTGGDFTSILWMMYDFLHRNRKGLANITWWNSNNFRESWNEDKQNNTVSDNDCTLVLVKDICIYAQSIASDNV